MSEKKYYYRTGKTDTSVCLEECPFKKGVNIGSSICRTCEHNQGGGPVSYEDDWIVCDWIICAKMKDEDIPSLAKTVMFIPLSTDKNQKYQYPRDSKILGLAGFDNTQHLVILQPKEVKKYIPLEIEIYLAEEEIDVDGKEYIGCIYSGHDVKVVFKIN